MTLTLLEEWTNNSFSEAHQQELQEFTRETGIRVQLLPSPESAREKLVLWQELMAAGASGPDVYGIDVIWPGILDEASHRSETLFRQRNRRAFSGDRRQLHRG